MKMGYRLVLGFLLFLSGCGAVITGVTIGFGMKSGSGTTNSSPVVTLTAPSSGANHNDLISFSYNLWDGESNPVNLVIQWSSNGVDWSDATELTGSTIDTTSDGKVAIQSSNFGISHRFVWNSFSDIPAANVDFVTVRFTPVDTSTGLKGRPDELVFNVVNLYTTTILGRNQPDSTRVPYWPHSFFVDGETNKCYISNQKTHTIISLDLVTGQTTTQAGTGLTPYNGDDILGTLANLNHPSGITIGYDRASGDKGVVFADTYNHRLRFLNLTTKFVSTIAGTGIAGYDESFGAFNSPRSQKLSRPFGVYVVPSVNGQGLGLDGYVFSEQGNRTVRLLNWSTGTIIFQSGVMAFGTSIAISIPSNGLATIGGNYFLDDHPTDGPIWVGASLPFSTVGRFRSPGSLQFIRPFQSPADPLLFVADDNMIRVANLGTTTQTMFPKASSPVVVPPGYIATLLNMPKVAGSKLKNNLYAPRAIPGPLGGLLVMPQKKGYAQSPALLFSEGDQHSIWIIDGQFGTVNRWVGNGNMGYGGDGGPIKQATMALPQGLAFTTSTLLIADQFNNRIRAVNLSTTTQTIAQKSIGSLNIDTIALGPTNSELSFPVKIAVDSATQEVYICDRKANRILKVDPSTRVKQVVAGAGGGDSSGDGGPAVSANLGNPRGMAIWTSPSQKMILIADNGGLQTLLAGPGFTLGKIRMVNLNSSDLTFGSVSSLPSGQIQTLVGGGTVVYTTASSDDLDNVLPLKVRLGTVRDVMIDTPEGSNLPGVYILEQRFGNTNTSPYRLLVYNPNSSYNFKFNIRGLGVRTVSPGRVSALAIYKRNSPTGLARPLSLGYFRRPGRSFLIGGARNDPAKTSLIALIPLIKNHIVLGLNYRNADKTVVNVNIPAGQGAKLAGVENQGGYNGDWQNSLTSKLNSPKGIFYIPANPPQDPNDNLVIADADNHRIRVVFGKGAGPLEGSIITFMGSGLPGYNGDTLPPGNTHLNGPNHIFAIRTTNFKGKVADIIFICDANNGRVRRFCVESDK